MKKHHKWILGSFGSFVIILLIATSIFTYMIFTKQNTNYEELDEKIKDTQNKINLLSNDLNLVDLQVNSIDQNLADLNSVNSDFSQIINDSLESVVSITGVSEGTGFFIYEDYIVTNRHIMRNNGDSKKYAIVKTYDGKEYIAYDVKDDRTSDISLLKVIGTSTDSRFLFENSDNDFDDPALMLELNIDPSTLTLEDNNWTSNYPSLKFGNSDDMKLGEEVIAIGNPLGLQFSVTEGIVSAVRKVGEDGKGYIQTDTPLNPGNSGGPLINKKGEIIGINNLKAPFTDGLGFALESNYVKEIVNRISLEELGYRLI
jgi:S1-C subfamily serine protease